MTVESAIPAGGAIDLPADPSTVESADDSGGPQEPDRDAPGATPPAGSRRRRIVLLILLLATLVFLLIAAWYLITRKPLTQFPIPIVPAAVVPHYSHSIYDVVAPTGVAVSADGSRIYATQTEADRQVIGFDASGNQIASLVPPTTGGDHVPVYVAVHPTTGDVFVSDRPAASIYVFSSDGTFLRTFDPGPRFGGWAPLGLAFDAKGDLFVTNVGAPFESVQQFGPDGKFVRTYGAEGELAFPNGVSVDANGNVYVSDSNNGRLVIFDRMGNKLGLVRRGVGVGDLGLPRGSAIDDAGRIYVADISQQGVQAYQALASGERQPRFIGGFGQAGTADGSFQLPNAVAVDGRGRVYVADWRNNRIQVWSY
jgi:DNA-binding beta-propeller fold protein YncE